MREIAVAMSDQNVVTVLWNIRRCPAEFLDSLRHKSSALRCYTEFEFDATKQKVSYEFIFVVINQLSKHRTNRTNLETRL